jgi:stage IV sporulation protein B
MILDVVRDGMELSFRLTPIQDETGCYRAGIWVRNNTQGIGTLTYVDEDGNFGALGHGISDIDTGELLSISEGTLFDADVVSVIRGERGTPGELSGVIHYSEGHAIGNITGNTKNGIYGIIDNITGITKGKTLYETAGQEEIKTGPAVIVCTVDGVSREYGIEIQQVRMNARDENKGMILKVTDERLLEVTGGIVQGMSGSPIIQDGKLVGAVTHVLVNDPTRGYGIFIENMLEYEA